MDSFFEKLNDNGDIVPKAELLSIKPFKQLWNKDKTRKKTVAIMQLTFIWALCSKDETECHYALFDNREQRYREAYNDIWDSNEKPDENELLKECMVKYREMEPKNEFDEQAEFKYEQILEMRTFLRSLDKNERTDNGALILKPADFQKATAELDKMVKDLDEMKTLAKEKRNRDKAIRGGGEEGLFENPNKADSYL